MMIINIALSLLCLGGDGKDEDKNGNVKYIGSAFEAGGSKALYIENHEEIYKQGKHVETITNYKDLKGNSIAYRTLIFEKSQLSPNYDFEDKRTGYKEGAVLQGNKLKIYKKEKSGATIQEKTIKAPASVVIDGGFNYYLKENFEAVKKGKNLSFYFTVPSRLDYYKFRIRKAKELQLQGKAAMMVYLEPDNFVLRALIDPIIIYYDMETKRIVSYEGISNINSGNGDNYIVKLVYPKLGP